MTSVESRQDEQPLEFVARYGDRKFRYHLRYLPQHKKATIRVHVQASGMVQVDAPKDAQLPAIKRAVQRRARWVLKHLDDIEERHRDIRPREWVSGESVFYLDRRYVLKVINDPEQRKINCKLIAGQLQVRGKNINPEQTKKAVRQWYRDRASEVFKRRLDLMVNMLPWAKTSPAWRIMEMQTQWGSCSPKGEILLNPNLIKAPTRAIDYVILHELCHLVEHNHSPKFYGLLNQFMPEWRSVKDKLDGRAELILTPNNK